MPQVARALMKMRTNDAMLVGPAGVGKTAIIREFARRVKDGDESIPVSLHGAEVFQISPENLTVGAVSRPQFMNRIETLKEHLQKHPKIILVINPMDALVSKDNRRPDTVMLEELTRQLIQSNIPILQLPCLPVLTCCWIRSLNGKASLKCSVFQNRQQIGSLAS